MSGTGNPGTIALPSWALQSFAKDRRSETITANWSHFLLNAAKCLRGALVWSKGRALMMGRLVSFGQEVTFAQAEAVKWRQKWVKGGGKLFLTNRT